jgi:hypothetical protein
MEITHAKLVIMVEAVSIFGHYPRNRLKDLKKA